MKTIPTTTVSTRRDFIRVCTAVAAGCAAAPLLADDPAVEPGDRLSYSFVNATNGKWTDADCFWSMNDGKDWHSFADSPTAPCPDGGGRVYFRVGPAPKNFDDRSAYWDFIEWNYKSGGNWSGNTTQVDAFGLPITIQLGDHKVGIDKPRTKLFKDFSTGCPEPFRDCLKGDFWILSPARAGFRKGGKHGDYFDQYVDEIWTAYAIKKPTPSGKYVGEVTGAALTFTPVDGGKPLVCDAKPSTQDIFVGEGVLARNAPFCAAFNRHVAADPADWKNPDNFYQAEPCNWYSKFLHEQAVDRRCYGFCYDDVAEQAAYFSAKGSTLTVTIHWDEAGR